MTAPIWFDADPLGAFGDHPPGMMQHLGIELEVGPDFLAGRMPVDHRTRQPFGLLHGGASVVLAETLASLGSAAVIGQGRGGCVGLEINANHVRGVSSGWVHATARPLHLGRTTHVWDIRIVDDQDRLVCISRCTIAVLPPRQAVADLTTKS